MTTSIALDGVSVVYESPGRRSVPAIDGISLSVEESEFVVVIGPNGAGKSTLAAVIAGSVPPSRGRVMVGGRDVTRQSESHRARTIGRVFQDPRQGTCGDLSVKENLALAATRGRPRSPLRAGVRRRELTRFVDLLAEYGRGLEARLDDAVDELSGGQRQLLSMVMAVIQRPALLLLDEHTSSLDLDAAELVIERTQALVRALRLTTVMITHSMRHAANVGERVVLMHRGHLVDEIKGDEKQMLDEHLLTARFRALLDADHRTRMLG